GTGRVNVRMTQRKIFSPTHTTNTALCGPPALITYCLLASRSGFGGLALFQEAVHAGVGAHFVIEVVAPAHRREVAGAEAGGAGLAHHHGMEQSAFQWDQATVQP